MSDETHEKRARAVPGARGAKGVVCLPLVEQPVHRILVGLRRLHYVLAVVEGQGTGKRVEKEALRATLGRVIRAQSHLVRLKLQRMRPGLSPGLLELVEDALAQTDTRRREDGRARDDVQKPGRTMAGCDRFETMTPANLVGEVACGADEVGKG